MTRYLAQHGETQQKLNKDTNKTRNLNKVSNSAQQGAGVCGQGHVMSPCDLQGLMGNVVGKRGSGADITQCFTRFKTARFLTQICLSKNDISQFAQH